MAKQVKIDTEADDEIAGTAGKAEIEQFTPAPKKEFPQAKNIAALRSPLMRSSNKLFLRPRKGWHQTWIDADDVEAVKDVYAFIRKPAKPEEEAGRESGEILKIREDRDHALVAMEASENHVGTKPQPLFGPERYLAGIFVWKKPGSRQPAGTFAGKSYDGGR